MEKLSECPKCASRELRAQKYPETKTVDGVEIHTVVEGLECASCLERYFDGASLIAAEEAEAAALVAAGIPGPRGFQAVRKALDLRAADLAKLLDVTPESLSRWETGTREIPRYARAILATLWLERDAQGELRGVLERMAAA